MSSTQALLLSRMLPVACTGFAVWFSYRSLSVTPRKPAHATIPLQLNARSLHIQKSQYNKAYADMTYASHNTFFLKYSIRMNFLIWRQFAYCCDSNRFIYFQLGENSHMGEIVIVLLCYRKMFTYTPDKTFSIRPHDPYNILLTLPGRQLFYKWITCTSLRPWKA